eukprot:gene7520-biopygen15091
MRPPLQLAKRASPKAGTVRGNRDGDKGGRGQPLRRDLSGREIRPQHAPASSSEFPPRCARLLPFLPPPPAADEEDEEREACPQHAVRGLLPLLRLFHFRHDAQREKRQRTRPGRAPQPFPLSARAPPCPGRYITFRGFRGLHGVGTSAKNIFRERGFRTTSSAPPPTPLCVGRNPGSRATPSRCVRRDSPCARSSSLRDGVSPPSQRGVGGGGGVRGVGDFGIFRGAFRRANPRLAPRVHPHPAARPGRAEGADGTGGWSRFPTTVPGPLFSNLGVRLAETGSRHVD